MANFIDFIAEASANPDTTKEFINILSVATPEDLKKWLDSKGFEVSVDDCKKLVDSKENIVNVRDVSVKGDY